MVRVIHEHKNTPDFSSRVSARLSHTCETVAHYTFLFG